MLELSSSLCYTSKIMDSDTKNYELAYLLSPSLPEEDVLVWSNKIAALIEEAHGVIRRFEPPKKRQLSYPIKKTSFAYFGWIVFTVAPDVVLQINKKVKELEHILRHLTTEIGEADTRPRVYPLRSVRKAPLQETKQPVREKKDEALDLEALDKKLEEILGK